MAKCGHTICPDEDCGWTYLFSGERRDNCRRVQHCFEDSSSSLKALGPSGFLLYDACLGHCHRQENNPKYPSAYASTNEYLCNNFDPVMLVDYFGANVCGVPGEETKVGQVQQATETSNAQTRWVLFFIAIVILILLSALLWKNKDK